MNISLPEALKAFIDEQVAARGFGTSSEFIRELVRREQDRVQLRAVLLEGAASAPDGEADDAYFDAMRTRVRAALASKR